MQSTPSMDNRLVRTRRIGNRIKGRREEIGLTQQQLAERTGIKSIRVSRIELGLVRMLADEVRAFAAALGLSFDDVLGGPAAEAQE